MKDRFSRLIFSAALFWIFVLNASVPVYAFVDFNGRVLPQRPFHLSSRQFRHLIRQQKEPDVQNKHTSSSWLIFPFTQFSKNFCKP